MNKTNASKSNITKDIFHQQNFLIEKGIKSISLKQYEEANDYFSKVLSLNSQNTTCLLYRSQCNFLQGKYKASFLDSMSSIRIDPKSIISYYQSSRALLEMYQFDKANELLSHAELLQKLAKTTSNNLELISLREIYKQRSSLMTQKILADSSYIKYITFMQVLLFDHNSSINKIEIGIGKDARGVFAIDNIKDKEIIIQLPKDALISLEIACNSLAGMQITKDIKLKLNSPNHCILSVYLLEEIIKGDSSQWKFYIDMLPCDYSNFPIFFIKSELELLQGTQFCHELYTKKWEIQQDYNLLNKSIDGFSNRHTLEKFSKVRMIISSRIFGIVINNIKTDVLAPYADLLNHRRPKQTHWNYHDKTNSFEVIAMEDIAKGNEVFDSYGKKCNNRFLLNYGFVIEDNEDDIIKITIVVNDNNCLMFKEKIQLMNGVWKKIFTLKKCIEDNDTIALLSLLRFMYYDGNVMEFCKGVFDIKNIPLVSIENERSAMNKLLMICEEMMKNYPTTIEEDKRLIQLNHNLTSNQRNCILMRLSEKEIIKYYNDFALNSLKCLGMNLEALNELIENWDQSDHYYSYKHALYDYLFVTNNQ